MADVEPVGVTIIGGIKINTISSTSIYAVGDNSFQTLNSTNKNNLITGQLYGDFNLNNQQPFASTIIDPDGFDSNAPNVTPSGIGLGIED